MKTTHEPTHAQTAIADELASRWGCSRVSRPNRRGARIVAGLMLDTEMELWLVHPDGTREHPRYY